MLAYCSAAFGRNDHFLRLTPARAIFTVLPHSAAGIGPQFFYE
jgi:hypothetical protein